MDSVILSKLENIKNCLTRINDKKPFTLDELTQNYDLQDIITVNIQRVIQSSVDLANHICVLKNAKTPQDMAESFEILKDLKVIDEDLCLNLKKSVGLRNVLVHEYSGINWQIVHEVVQSRLHVFQDFIKAILNFN